MRRSTAVRLLGWLTLLTVVAVLPLCLGAQGQSTDCYVYYPDQCYATGEYGGACSPIVTNVVNTNYCKELCPPLLDVGCCSYTTQTVTYGPNGLLPPSCPCANSQSTYITFASYWSSTCCDTPGDPSAFAGCFNATVNGGCGSICPQSEDHRQVTGARRHNAGAVP